MASGSDTGVAGRPCRAAAAPRRRARRGPGGRSTRSVAVDGRESVAPTTSAAGEPRGAGDRAEERAGGTVVPRRGDDERVEGQRTADRLRPPGCRRTTRTAPRPRRARCGARRGRRRRRSDRRRGRGRRSAGRCARRRRSARWRPAASPRRGSAGRTRPGATPRTPRGPPEPTRTPASSVPCRSTCRRCCGLRCAEASPVPPTTSMPGQDPAAEVRMAAVDARVEQARS